MASRGALLCLALLCAAVSATYAAGREVESVERSEGRQLLGKYHYYPTYTDNTGQQWVYQTGINAAVGNGQVNQANVNQAAQQVGKGGVAANGAYVAQQNNAGRKLLGFNFGYQDVSQLGANVAAYNGQVNQANVNQAAQQVGDHGIAENYASVAQENNAGRKLQSYFDNFGNQYVQQTGINAALYNGQVNQANVNQAAQQVGDHGVAENYASVAQQNNAGRKLLTLYYPSFTTNEGYQYVSQTGINIAEGNGQVNQANVNQAAQQVGNYGVAYNGADVEQQNNAGRKLLTLYYPSFTTNEGYQYVSQTGINIAEGNGQVNQANVNQAAQQVGNYGVAFNGADVEQQNNAGR